MKHDEENKYLEFAIKCLLMPVVEKAIDESYDQIEASRKKLQDFLFANFGEARTTAKFAEETALASKDVVIKKSIRKHIDVLRASLLDV